MNYLHCNLININEVILAKINLAILFARQSLKDGIDLTQIFEIQTILLYW